MLCILEDTGFFGTGASSILVKRQIALHCAWRLDRHDDVDFGMDPSWCSPL